MSLFAGTVKMYFPLASELVLMDPSSKMAICTSGILTPSSSFMVPEILAVCPKQITPNKNRIKV
jgi:hypothetical protein